MRKPELLAPAGNMESLKAAILAGCDAVYLGGYMFGARSFAGNFSNEEIIEAVSYAHLYGVKIYVTANTIVYEDEVETFLNYIDFLYKNQVDAVIIQDIGMLDLIRQTYPLLEVHASTQMHLHNLEGIKLVESVGVKRAVLARETDIDLIKEIRQKTDIELEVFVHGALCVSYSGQCLMSSLIGGRSGNRGSCAGSCRQMYDLIIEENNRLKKVNKDKYLLSMKDLNTLEHIGELIDIGVHSLKIEGRMKRPEYVYLVVKLYRKAIDQYCKDKKIKISEEEIIELKKIFNRDFTKGFLFHEKEENIIHQKRPNHMGVLIGKVVASKKNFITISLDGSLANGDGIRILGKEDSGTIITKIIQDGKQCQNVKNGIVQIPYQKPVEMGSIVLKTTDKKQLEQIEDALKEQRKIEISLLLELKIGKKPILVLNDGKQEVISEGTYIIEKALNAALSKERILMQMHKFGDSVYTVREVQIQMDDNLFIPIKELNELRRNAILKLNQKRCYRYPYQKEKYHRNVPSFPIVKQKSVFITSQEQYECLKNESFDYIYVEKRELWKQLQKEKNIIYKLPRVLHKIPDFEEPLLIGELGSFMAFPHSFIDWSLNVVNSYSAAFLFAHGAKQVTLSYELDARQIKLLIDAYKNRYHAHPNFELIIYGNEEVMISKFHLLKYFNIKKKTGYLKDRFSNLYPIKEEDFSMSIYNYKPRMIKNAFSYYDIGVNVLRYQFLEESNEQVKKVIKNEFE